MSIRDCLGQLQEHLTEVPVQIVADETRPYSVDTVLELPSLGLRMRFHALHQRLVIVHVFDPTKVTLLAGDSGQPFTGAAGPPSFQAAYALFGPTYPGQLERFKKYGNNESSESCDCSPSESGQESVVFMLQFQGVAFEFPVPPELEPAFAAPGLAFQPPLGCPGAQRLYLFHGHDVHVPQLPPLESGGGLRYMEPCHVCLNGSTSGSGESGNIDAPSANSEFTAIDSPTVLSFPDRGQGSACNMVLGKSTPQDVMALLGPPTTVFHQHDPRAHGAANKASAAVAAAMNAAGTAGLGAGGHLGSLHAQGSTSGYSGSSALNLSSSGGSSGSGGRSGTFDGENFLGDYFFGYPDAGLDVQFHGSLHVVHKVHLTANLPGRPDFMTYDRCYYTIFGLPLKKLSTSRTTLAPQPLQDHPNLASGPMTETQIFSVASAGVSVSAAQSTDDIAVREQPLPALVVSTASATVNVETTSPTSTLHKKPALVGAEVANTAPTSSTSSSKKKKKKGKGDSSAGDSKIVEKAKAAEEIDTTAIVKEGLDDTEIATREPIDAPQAEAEAAVQLAMRAATEAKSNAENQVAFALSDDMAASSQEVYSTVASSMHAADTTATPPSDEPPSFVTVATPWAELEARLFGMSLSSGLVDSGATSNVNAGVTNNSSISSNNADASLGSRPHFAVQNGDGQHPFGPTLLYCAEPHARALFEVSCDGFVCALTLY